MRIEVQFAAAVLGETAEPFDQQMDFLTSAHLQIGAGQIQSVDVAFAG